MKVLAARALPRLLVPALLAAGIAVPYVLRSYAVSLISLAFIAALLAASVNMLAGQMHLVSVGHAGIAASASYAVAWAHNHGHGYGAQLALAALLTLAVSVVYALTSMRTSGIFFLMVTLALGMVVFGLAYRMSQVTGGENGLSGMRRPPMFAETWKFYYLTLAALVLAVAALWVVTRSPFGLVLRGIRDSETRMTSLGYSVPAYKFAAILMSGAVAGLAGVMAVWHAEFVSPSSAGFLRSALTVIMVILGGVGTILGPILGAGIVIWTENVLSTYVERWPTVLGLIFIVVVLFAPKGIVGALQDLVARRRAARRRTTDKASDDETGTTEAPVPSSTPSGS
ncbi:MAG TPA: branched-chain amino acid ABC transporter permease [Thermopolyspora sp.]